MKERDVHSFLKSTRSTLTAYGLTVTEIRRSSTRFLTIFLKSQRNDTPPYRLESGGIVVDSQDGKALVKYLKAALTAVRKHRHFSAL